MQEKSFPQFSLGPPRLCSSDPCCQWVCWKPTPPSPLEKPEVPQENLQGPKTEERKNVFFPAPLWGLKQSLLAHSFIHSFCNKYLLRTYSVPGTAPGAGDPVRYKNDDVSAFGKLVAGQG